MSHITLVRHGQANSQATDEAGYDRLSPLGHKQAVWLGEHLRDSGIHHSRVYCGTLRRQIETAQGLGYGDIVVQDARLNELAYFNLANLLKDQQGVEIPTEREGFIDHLPKVFTAWQAGEIEDAPETFVEFESRVRDVIDEISGGSGPAMAVSSGGVISISMRLTMGLDINATTRIALAIMNTSMHRLFPMGNHLSPVLFNAVPHLEKPKRHYAQTHY